MKKLSGFNKLMFVLNVLLTLATFIAYLLPFLAPKLFPILSVFTLIMPLMLVLNGLFFIYWLLQLKKQMLLSGLVLLLGITFISKFYKFSGRDTEPEEGDIRLMSYNVRLFNMYKWLPQDGIVDSVKAFVAKHDPDIICFQEFANAGEPRIKGFKYKFVFSNNDNPKSGQAIYSKYKIVDTGTIRFPNTSNNVIFADIKKGKDTIRMYSMHLQSIRISQDIHEQMDEQRSRAIFRRLSNAFKKQQHQAEMISAHKKECPYPMVICGDLNNSAFSYVYRSVRGNLQDAFEEAGKGFGKSYNFKYYPARIDYIFADKRLQVKEYTTYPGFVNSDHFPVITRLKLEEPEK